MVPVLASGNEHVNPGALVASHNTGSSYQRPFEQHDIAMTGVWAQNSSLGPRPVQIEEADMYVFAQQHQVFRSHRKRRRQKCVPHKLMLTSALLFLIQACTTLKIPPQPPCSQVFSSKATAVLFSHVRSMIGLQVESSEKLDRPSGIIEWTVRARSRLVANAMESLANG